MKDAKTDVSVNDSRPSKVDKLYEKIGQFLESHPEAMDMTTEESDKLFEQWLGNGGNGKSLKS